MVCFLEARFGVSLTFRAIALRRSWRLQDAGESRSSQCHVQSALSLSLLVSTSCNVVVDL